MSADYFSIRNWLEEKKITLVAVSKTKSIEEIMLLYNSGQRHFGENRVQELHEKYHQLPKDICWHMIGNLQKNKLKYIYQWIHLIQTADSKELLLELQKFGMKANKPIACLLQIHIAQEKNKHGFTEQELLSLCKDSYISTLNFVEVKGLMAIATNTENIETIREEFKKINSLFLFLKNTCFKQSTAFNQLSMGMSGDYKLAVEEGATMVRIGSLLFGNRIN